MKVDNLVVTQEKSFVKPVEKALEPGGAEVKDENQPDELDEKIKAARTAAAKIKALDEVRDQARQLPALVKEKARQEKLAWAAEQLSAATVDA